MHMMRRRDRLTYNRQIRWILAESLIGEDGMMLLVVDGVARIFGSLSSYDRIPGDENL
jgi:hypothetical protein